MIPLNLKICNFLSFQEASINLDDKGLVCVEGENLDGNGSSSNGSGKSSLFIAIRWCLYGTMDKDMAADEVINSKAGKGCMVQTTWLDNLTSVHYRITRHRKHPKHKNKLQFETKHPGFDWVDETLGKNDLTQVLVNKAIGMDDKVFTAACFASQEDAIDIPAMSDKELKNLIENTLPYQSFDAKYIKYKGIYDGKKREYEDLRYKLTHASNEIDLLETNLNSLKKTSEVRVLGLAASLGVCKEELKEIHQRVSDLNKSIMPNMEETRATIDKLYTHLKVLDNPRTLEAALEGSRKAVENLSEQFRYLGSATDCPACKRPVEPADIEDHKEKIRKELEVALANYNSIKEKYEKAKDDEVLRNRINSKILDLENQYASSLRHQKKKDDLIPIIREKEYFITTADIDPYKEPIENLTITIAEKKKQLVELESELSVKQEEVEIYTNIVEVLSPKGFRYHMLETITPELNSRTNYYLAMLTDGKIGAIWSTVSKLSTGEYKEEFSIKAGMNGRTNYGALSGGQKRKVRLACWFAIQDLIAARAEKDVKLWICDEVDGALDKAGIERLMSLLEEKARERGTVLVISHNNMRDWIANHIKVIMKDDVSTVSGFLNERS